MRICETIVLIALLGFATAMANQVIGPVALLIGWAIAGCTAFCLLSNGKPFKNGWNIAKTGTLAIFLIFGPVGLIVIPFFPEKSD